MIGYYLGVVVGSLVWAVVVVNAGRRRWLPYAVNVPLVAAGAAVASWLS